MILRRGNQLIPIPHYSIFGRRLEDFSTKSLWWSYSNQSSMWDLAANTIQLVSNVSKRQYDSFVRILSTRNPTTPEEAIGNMASIFAHSGKMTQAQAEGSYYLWSSKCFGLSGPRNHSKTMTPMCTIFFMALKTKEHLSFLLKNWFDLGTSPSARTWQIVDILLMDFIQQEKLQPKLPNSLPASRSWPGRFWRLEKELCQSLLEGSMLDVTNILINCLVAMKKFKDFVENMALLKEEKILGGKIRTYNCSWRGWSPTRMLFDQPRHTMGFVRTSLHAQTFEAQTALWT